MAVHIPDTETFAMVDGSSIAFLTESGEISRVRAHKDRVTQLATVGEFLYSASLDGTIVEWKGTRYTPHSIGAPILGV
jgi:hypothetical protein